MVVRRFFISVLVCMLPVILPLAAVCYAQDGTATFADFIGKVEKQTGYSIAYATGDVPRRVTVPDISGLGPREAIWTVLDSEMYSLTVTGKHIIIKKTLPPTAPPVYNPPPAQDRTVYNLPGREPAADLPVIRRTSRPDTLRSSVTPRLIILQKDTVQPRQNRPRTVTLPGRSSGTGDTTVWAGVATEIPFRTDLLDEQVYSVPLPQTNKEKREARKRSRSGR